MKNLMKLTVLVFSVSFLSNSIFAQNVQSVNQVKVQQRTNWIDANGDGICDNFGTTNQGSAMQGKRMGRKGMSSASGTQMQGQGGFGDGTGLRPQDGTGFGRKNGNGLGTCDGTGSGGSNGHKGNGRRGNR